MRNVRLPWGFYRGGQTWSKHPLIEARQKETGVPAIGGEFVAGGPRFAANEPLEAKPAQGARGRFDPVRLPVGAGEDDVKATYDNGILEVRIPIDERSNGVKKIPISRAFMSLKPRILSFATGPCMTRSNIQRR